MSEFTTTPFLGLYKPVPGEDVDLWGTHWNANADTLDGALQAYDSVMGDGPWLPLAGGTVTGLVSSTRTIGLNLGTGIMLQLGDTVLANNNPLLVSYKVGTSSGAVTSLGFNSYISAPGAGGQRINAAKNGWSIQHDTRTTADGSLVLGVTSSTGVSTSPITFGPSGTLGVANSQALGAGGLFFTPFTVSGALSGLKTGGNLGFARVNITADTMSAAAGGGLAELSLEYHGGGAGTVGNRLGLNIDFNFAGGDTNKSLGAGLMYGGFWSYARVSGNVGGTAGAGNAWGLLWGGLSSATAQSGATFWDSIIGHEFNMGISAGASAARLQGIKVVTQHNAQVMNVASDYMIGLAQAYNTDTQMPTGLSFGSDDGHWPIRSDGRLISTIRSNALLAGPLPRTAAFGIDFSDVTFSTAFLKSTGFIVDGAGRCSPLLFNAATDAAAAAGGVPIGALYRNAGAVMVRLV